MLRVVETMMAAIDVRQQVAPDDAPVRHADRARRLDESRSLSDRNSPRMTRASHIQEKTPRKRIDAQHRAAIHREEDQEQEDGGEGEHQIDEAHQQRVDPAAVVAGDGPDHDPDQRRDQRGADADGERDAAAVDQAAQLIPPQLVGAEHVRLPMAGR